MGNDITTFLAELASQTNKQLIEYCKANDIQIKTSKPNKVPNKKELLDSIKDFMNSNIVDTNAGTVEDAMDEVGSNVTEAEIDTRNDIATIEDDGDDDFLNFDPTPALSVVEATKKELDNEDKLKMIKEQKKLIRVQVQINQEFGEKSVPNQAFEVSWGNAITGVIHEVFPIGVPWHLTQGSIDALDRIKVDKIEIDSYGNVTGTKPIKKFFITKLEPLTPDEIKQLAKQQLIRNSN